MLSKQKLVLLVVGIAAWTVVFFLYFGYTGNSIIPTGNTGGGSSAGSAEVEAGNDPNSLPDIGAWKREQERRETLASEEAIGSPPGEDERPPVTATTTSNIESTTNAGTLVDNTPTASRQQQERGEEADEEFLTLRFLKEGEPLAGIKAKMLATELKDLAKWRATNPTLEDGWEVLVTDGSGEVSIMRREPGSPLDITVWNEEIGWGGLSRTFPPESQSSLEVPIYDFGTIEGRVATQDDAPLSNIGVTLSVRTEIDSPNQRVSFRGPLSQKRTTTERDGSYRFEKVSHFAEVRLSGSYGRISSSRNDHGYLDMRASQEYTDIDFQLNVSNYFIGYIENKDGQPIEGASVRFENGWNGESDEDGIFTLPMSHGGGLANWVFINHPDYQSRRFTSIPITDEPATFTLFRKQQLLLQVVDEEKVPVPVYTAKIFQYRPNGRKFALTFDGKQERQVNDPEGITVFDNLNVAQYQVAVRTEEGLKATKDFTANIQEYQEIILPLTRGKGLYGAVVDLTTDSPLSKAQVRLYNRESYSRDSLPFMETLSDEEGVFYFEGVTSGNFRVEATLENSSAYRNIDIPVGKDPESVVIPVDYYVTVWGEVIDEVGHPVPDATIQLDPYQVAGGKRYSLKTEKDGTFEFENVAPGTYHASCRYDQTNERDFVTIPGGENFELSFRQTDKMNLTGRLTVDDIPWRRRPQFFISTLDDHSDKAYLRNTGDGRYEVSIRKGDLALWAHFDSSIVNVGQYPLSMVSDADGPNPTLDFDVEFAHADVFLNYPEGIEPVSGEVSISRPAEDLIDLNGSGQRTTMIGTEGHVGFMTPGVYTAIFESDDKNFVGTSETKELRGGSIGEFNIDVTRQAINKRIGSWRTDLIGRNFAPFDLDVTGELAGVTDFRIAFHWGDGSNVIVVESVQLLIDGEVVSRDDHLGWSGTTRRDHVYRLTNPQPNNTTSSMVIRSMAQSDGESSGGVYLFVPQE